ncbi:MAG: hypothetical protein BroJett007_15980 [Chloroflexota bacterium]|nr:MAG: hypothetical protein BroJett007_15980 [Chloroflexota bacterium]
MHKRIRRADHWLGRAPAVTDPRREHGLSRRQLARQADHIPRPEQRAEALTETMSLFSTMADEVEFTRFKDGHDEPYPTEFKVATAIIPHVLIDGLPECRRMG